MGQPVEFLRFQTTGDAKSGQLAEAVSGGGIGADAERFEDAPRAKRNRAESRLSDVGGSQRFVVGAAIVRCKRQKRINALDKASGGRNSRTSIYLGKGLVHSREATRQLAQHPRILRSLSGKEDGQLAGARAAVEENTFGTLQSILVAAAAQERSCALDKTRQVGGLALNDEKQATGRRRVPSEPSLGGKGAEDRPLQLRRPILQLSFDVCRDRSAEGENLRVAVPIDHFLVRSRLFEYRMKVTAAEAKRADGGAARMVRRGQPRARLGVDVKGAVGGLERFEGLAHLDRRRQDFVM